MEKVTDKSTAIAQVLKCWNDKYDFSVKDVAEAAYQAGLEEAARAMCEMCADSRRTKAETVCGGTWVHKVGSHNCVDCAAAPIHAIRAMAQPEPPTAYEMSRISPQLCEVHGVVHKCELMAAPAVAKIGEWRCKKCKHAITGKSNACLQEECYCSCEIEHK